jgi:SNF2 family DNA or RNA helicase
VNELVTASHAVFGSMSQQRDDYEQAKARLDRQGQTKPVTFWHCLAPKTVDEVVMAAHQRRDDLEAAMLAHVMNPPREESA